MKLRSKKDLTDKIIMEELRKHSSILRKYKVRKIGLFGSFIRGEQKIHSDIDFLVEFEDPNFDNFMDLVFSLEDLFNRRIELITNGSLSPYMRPYIEREVKWYETHRRN